MIHLWWRRILDWRPRAPHMTMGRRVSVLASVSVALAVLVVGLSAYLMTRITLYDQLDDQLTSLAMSMSTPIGADIDNLGGLDSAAMRTADATLVLIKADGSTETIPGASRRITTGPEELAIARLGIGTEARTVVDSKGDAMRIVAVPLQTSPLQTSSGSYALVMGRSLSETQAVLRSLWTVLLVAGIVGVAATAIAGYWAAVDATRPIRDLSRAVHRVSATDELVPIKVHSHDELGDLARSFNTMLSSLTNSRERQKRLIADASHELRTPLTSMRTNVELLMADQKSGMLPPEAKGEILTDIAAQLGEFSSLIGDLVQLSREDAPPPRPEQFDLADVVTKAVDRGRRRGPGLTFDVETATHPMLGDPQAIERTVTNLLDNAVKFSPPGGTVTVRMDGDTVTVYDEGPGIADEDLPHIFERFYRSDRARNTPGTGLGLSIVAHTVSSHGGWIKASRAPSGGAMFTVHLPRHDRPVEETASEEA